VKTQGYVVLTLKFQKKGRRWTALCEELGTATFGRSLPEADQRLKEAILLHLNTLEDVGERERFFNDNNIIELPSFNVN
jgi:predicted RNase H-like HicB family nuclease